MENEFNIVVNPLSEEEFKKHNIENKILKFPSKYHLIDVMKALKFGRPTESQNMLNKVIAMMELAPERGEPFSPEIVGLVFGKEE